MFREPERGEGENYLAFTIPDEFEVVTPSLSSLSGLSRMYPTRETSAFGSETSVLRLFNVIAESVTSFRSLW
jgi:hypothetical protein